MSDVTVQKESTSHGKHRKPVHISYTDTKVLVTTEDEDRFMLSAAKAIEACKIAAAREQPISLFKNTLLLPLIQWCKKMGDRVAACYLGAPRSSSLPIYVIAKPGAYDFTLAEEMINLTDELEKNGWAVHTIQFPVGPIEELSALFNVGRSLVVYESGD